MENFIFLYSEVIELKLALDTSNALHIILNGVIMLIVFLLTKVQVCLNGGNLERQNWGGVIHLVRAQSALKI